MTNRNHFGCNLPSSLSFPAIPLKPARGLGIVVSSGVGLGEARLPNDCSAFWCFDTEIIHIFSLT